MPFFTRKNVRSPQDHPLVIIAICLLSFSFGGLGAAFHLLFVAPDPFVFSLLTMFDLIRYPSVCAAAAFASLFGLALIFDIAFAAPFFWSLRYPTWEHYEQIRKECEQIREHLLGDKPCPLPVPARSWRTVLQSLILFFRDGFFALGVTYILLFVVGAIALDNDLITEISVDLFRVKILAFIVFVLGACSPLILDVLRLPFLLWKSRNHTKSLIFFCLLMAMPVSGCAHKGLGGSFVGDLPTGAAVHSIAADAAVQIAGLYPPGHTSVLLLTPKKDAGNDFSVAFEDALRRRGFTVSTAADSTTVAVAYVLDHLSSDEDGEAPAWYLQLRISDNEEGGTAFARSYTASGRPEGGRSRTSIAFSRSTAAHLADNVVAKADKAYDSSMESLME